MDPMNPMGGGGMTPEQMQAYLEFVSGQGAFDEQNDAIQKQIAMANALRNQPMEQYRTGKGAALGGAGYALNQFLGSRDVANAQAKGAAQQQARIDALRKMAAVQMQPQPQAQMQPPGGGFIDPSVAAIYARRRQAVPYQVDQGAGGD